MLLLGWMEGKYTGIRYVHSEAEVEARVWYEASRSMQYKQEERVVTGNFEKRYFVKLNNFQINLYKSIPNFEKYDTINERKKLKIFSDFYLPIELGIDQYQEVTSVEKTYTYEELKDMMIHELELQLSEEIGNATNIINKQINEKEIDGGVEVQLIYEILENIGVEKKIDVTAEQDAKEREDEQWQKKD